MSIDPARIAELPFDSKTTPRDPLSAAQQAMQAGNYDEAIVYLLGYLLLALDQKRLIHLQRGKTNRMYLRELTNQPTLGTIVNSAVMPFEASYFGKHSVTRMQFMTAWQQVELFHQQLQTASPSARPPDAKSVRGGSRTDDTSLADTSLSSDAPGSDAPGSDAPGSDAPGSDAPGSDAPGRVAPGSSEGASKPGKLPLGFLLGASCLGTAGCGAWSSETHTYAAVASPDANRSLNGLGLHRKLWEAQGARCSTPSTLSPKLNQMDVIVLVGQSYEPPGVEARRWLEHWLASGDQRTLLYFGRDFNADILYRQQTLDELSGDHRKRGEELLALRQVDELQARWQQLPGTFFCDWFFIDAHRTTHDYQNFQSDWPESEQVTDDWIENDSLNGDAANGKWPVGVALHPPDAKFWRDKLTQENDELTVADSQASQSSDNSSHSDPGDTKSSHGSQQPPRRSRWSPDEFGASSQRLAALQNPLKSEILFSGDDGQALIFRLTDKASHNARLGSGQIVIIANGFPILNGSLVTPLGAQLGQRVIDICGPAERVALLAFDQSGLLISENEESGLSGAGLEMLTVWPLSAITMPAALLGIIACAALWPILGRPQQLAERSVSDLGLHIEAIGRLMSETHDRQYAAETIAEYFKKVRHEKPPEWLSDTLPHSAIPAPYARDKYSDSVGS